MKKLILICLAFCLVISCQESDQIQEVSKTQLVDYQSFSKELGDILGQVSSNMRSRNIKVMDSHEFRNEIKNVLTVNDNYGKTFDESYNYASALVDVERGRVEKKTIYVTPYQYEVFKQVDELWYLSTSPDIYRDGLEALLAEVIASEAEVEEKNPLLIYFSSQLVAHTFIESNLDLLGLTSERGRGGNWWDDWGKCALGTIGSAGLGALAGAGYGGAGCTVVLPVIGTVACGVVGGVVGGIAGGVVGAAASCDSAFGGGSGGGKGCPSCYHKMEPCEEEQTCQDDGE